MAYDGDYPFPEGIGGTGNDTYSQGDILYADGANSLKIDGSTQCQFLIDAVYAKITLTNPRFG